MRSAPATPERMKDRSNTGRGGGRDDTKTDEESRRQRKQQRSTGSWEEPDSSILDDRRGELPDLPAAAISSAIVEWIDAAAQGAGVTAEHVATPFFGVASGLLGIARRVQATRSWRTPATMWACLIGQSGSGKTPAIDVTKRVLSFIERNRASEIVALQLAHDTRQEAAKAVLKRWKEQVAEAVEAGRPPPPKPEQASDIKPFVAPRLYVNDPTIERLAPLLEARPRGIIYIADELARLFLNMNRYSNGSDREFWLEAWDGKSFVVERQIGHRSPCRICWSESWADSNPTRCAGHSRGTPMGSMRDSSTPGRKSRPTPGRPTASRRSSRKSSTRLPGDATAGPGRRILFPPQRRAGAGRLRGLRRLCRLCAPREGRARRAGARILLQRDRACAAACGDAGFSGLVVDRRAGAAGNRTAPHRGGGDAFPGLLLAARQGRTAADGNHRQARRRPAGLRWIKANHKTEVAREEVRVEALGKRHDADQAQTIINSLVRGGWLRERTVPTAGRYAKRWDVNPQLHSR